MSAAKSEKPHSKQPEYKITGGMWANAWKIAAVIGVIGLGASLFGYTIDAKRFAFSYLFAFAFFLTLALGSMFFVLIQRLTSAAWSVTVRRTAEFFMAGIPALALLFLPILLVLTQLFSWMTPHNGGEHGEHAVAGEHATGGEHAAAPAEHATTETAPSEHGVIQRARLTQDEEYEQIEHHEEAHLLHEKRQFLNIPFFYIRVFIYFAAWIFIALRLFGWSTKQDATKDPQLTVKAHSFAPVATIIASLTLTFAAFDWLMALNPFWYSTIFGVWIFAGSILIAHAVITLVTLSLRKSGFLGDSVSVEHYHDLGKLSFGFTVFWAYISFAQFFLTWYASIPEETTFYHHRWGDGPWKTVSLLLLGLHFVFPFLLMLSRNIKRRPQMLVFGVLTLIVMHVVECYWIVMPNYTQTAAQQPGDVLAFHWLDVTSLLGVGGIYLAWVFRQMTQHKLIPVGDPRLPRSLAFENA